MDKCNCYHENYNRSECWGTKEREECSCGGDETKCNLYPEKRASAQVGKVIEDFRNRKQEYTYQETKDQFEMAWLTNAYIGMCESSDMDNVIKALEKQIPKKVIRYSDDESDHVFCPNCNECIGSNEIIWDDFYHRGWSAMYCQECGQAMIWK